MRHFTEILMLAVNEGLSRMYVLVDNELEAKETINHVHKVLKAHGVAANFLHNKHRVETTGNLSIEFIAFPTKTFEEVYRLAGAQMDIFYVSPSCIDGLTPSMLNYIWHRIRSKRLDIAGIYLADGSKYKGGDTQ